MGPPRERAYRFDASGHWRAGAAKGLAARGGGLVVAPPLAPTRIEPSEAGAVAALGPCGRLMWLREADGDLVELHAFGAERQGRIAVRTAEAIHPGPSRLWVRAGERLRLYAARTLQELGEVRVRGLVGMAPDGCDGLWLLVVGEGGTNVRRITAAGRFDEPPVAVAEATAPVAVASDPQRRRLAILDAPAEAAPAESEWRLHLVDLAAGKAHPPLRFALPPEAQPPRSIVLDPEGGIHIVSSAVPAVLAAVSDEGGETARQEIGLPRSRRVEGLLWAGGPILACDDGLYALGAAQEDEDGAPPAEAIFVTPTLKSPPDTPGGWNRAEIDVDLPVGAELRATIFASSSVALARDVDEALAASAGRPSARLALMEALLAKMPAREVRSQSYKGAGSQVLHLLLDGVAEPFLWLRLQISCPAGAGEAALKSLRVRYPDRSWLDDLPAIYRDQPGPAAQLRRFLAPFETVYRDIDEAIDGLPARIDPATAGADQLGWLLGWLGFPPTDGLPSNVQRRLLQAAGGLLCGRGTLAALREMLDIVTEGHAEAEDPAATTGFWVIGAGSGRLSPRLGSGTLIVARRESGFRPGAIRLGEAHLPPLCTDIGRTVGARCARIAVRIDVDPDRRPAILPIVASLLAMFVPAHCAIDLQVGRAGRSRRGGRLDRGWRLAGEAGGEEGQRLDDEDGIELGIETETGRWRLPSLEPPPFAIDGTTALDGARRLA